MDLLNMLYIAEKNRTFDQPLIMSPTDLQFFRKLRSNALKEAREKAGFTKPGFSTKTGLTRETLDRIENGRGSWNADTEIIYLYNLGLVGFQPIFREENGQRTIVAMAPVPLK